MSTIMIDFDNTIVEEKYPGIGKEIPGAIATINELYDMGHCIIISSCRAREHQEEMIQWLRAHGVKFCHVNENCRERIISYRTDCRKISADCYVDDKNLFSDKYIRDWDLIKTEICRKFGTSARRKCGMEFLNDRID